MKSEQSVRPIYRSTPFHLNPVLPGALRDGITRDWYNRGICTFGHLYELDNLKSFEQLRTSFGLPPAHFFKFLQVRDYIRVQQGGKLTTIEDFQIESMIRDKHNPKGFLSYAYNKFMSLAENKTLNVKIMWETDIDYAFEDCEWEEICNSSQSFSYNSRHKLLQFNLIHRTYLTPQRLHRISSSYSEYCPRCKTETGTLLL